MPAYISLLPLLPLAQLVNGDPLELRQVFDPFHSCSGCFRSSWTQGSECRTNTILLSTISRILNPPAAATPTYTPSQWCSDYLRQTDLATFKVNAEAIATSTSIEYDQPLVTKTDLSSPTSTAWCPLPSPGMECGWDTNTISPLEQGQDGSILDDGIGSAEECHQACLRRPACKAYRWDGRAGNPCGIFNVGIGPNGAHLINPTPGGNQWWDRNCQVDLPIGCKLGRYPYNNATVGPSKAVAVASASAQFVITPAPIATPGLNISVPTPSSVLAQSLPRLPVLPIAPVPPKDQDLPIQPSLPNKPGLVDLPTPPGPPNVPNVGPPASPNVRPLPVPVPHPPVVPGPRPIVEPIPRPIVEPISPSQIVPGPRPIIEPIPHPPALPIPHPPVTPGGLLAPNAAPRPTVIPLAKRNAPFPPYLADLSYIWSSVYVTPACSCIISSALPPVPSSVTTTITTYNATVTITTTTVDPFTVTVTPRQVTTYVNIV